MLEVLHEESSTFTDYTLDARSYSGNAFNAFTLALTATGYLYLGKGKKWKDFYVEMSTVNAVDTTLAFEYYNGTAWTALTVTDRTSVLTQSGFVKFSIPTDWEETTVDSKEKFWIRCQPALDLTGTTAIQGLSLVFSEDIDLIEKYRGVEDYRRSGDSSFITFHQAATNEIIQDLRNSGKVKTDSSGNLTDIDAWDLHEPTQVREAAAWKALELVFMEASNEVDDKADQLSTYSKNKYSAAFQLYLLSIDTDNDGVVDAAEQNYIRTIMVTRL